MISGVTHVVVEHDWVDYLAVLGGVVGALAGIVAIVFAIRSANDAKRSAASAEQSLALADESLGIMREEADAARLDRAREAEPVVMLEVSRFPAGGSALETPKYVMATLRLRNDGTRTAYRVMGKLFVPDLLRFVGSVLGSV